MLLKRPEGTDRTLIEPAALLLAEQVEIVPVRGFFEEATQTWSDRAFSCASQKKHNEAR